MDTVPTFNKEKNIQQRQQKQNYLWRGPYWQERKKAERM